MVVVPYARDGVSVSYFGAIAALKATRCIRLQASLSHCLASVGWRTEIGRLGVDVDGEKNKDRKLGGHAANLLHDGELGLS